MEIKLLSMFNGIIFKTGTISRINKRKDGVNIFFDTSIKLSANDIGKSVSCDGVCLTLISVKKKKIEFFLSKESISRSNFKYARVGKKVNLELPLKKGQDISGHICQGHVDGTAKLINKYKKDKAMIFEFSVKKNIIKQLVNKASISINGVSLTVSKILRNKFQIWLIPHTLKLTNLSNLSNGDVVNIEIDILSKYVKKYINEKKKI